VYVLGPPEKYTDIKITDSAKEMCPKLAAMSDFQPFVTAFKYRLGNTAGEDKSKIRQDCPFDKCYDVSPEDEKCRSFFQEFYGFSKDEGQGKEWRRIDSDWLATAGELALKIGDMTNNTSLVLAFEFTETKPRKVLLFPGDAQVGNWLSWYRPKEVKVDAEDLLNRTVFYKVGHHGSRNATLRQKGLEMTKDPELVAMIPVDEKWAKDRKKPWEHPAEKLLNSLEEKTRGRVLRADRISQMPGVLVKRDTIEKGDWQTFLKNIDWDRSPNSLWIQYTIEG
jgi:hypothetical protein